ncbi:RRQRL motif-containing zinc-binding protein [Streptomyces fildesensis]|uniref:RRQRL motif-containing zinc-binding protein n=1 Tax=Streptomyces fildesensis TaxID=375757 RepID=UPI0018DFE78D|nr:RRQRL motif-containing zinc-binding protein [Streptomyces fildesensis]
MSLVCGKCLGSASTPGTLPRHVWRCAPDGLATRRQLRALGLRPGGQGVQAEVFRPRYRRGPLVAYLYRIDLAKPVRPMTPAKWAALALANTARRICPDCHRDAGYVIPTSLGCCVTCAYPEQHAA